MVHASKEQKGNVLIVKLVGSIEENADFDNLIGQTTKEMVINCREIIRINSVGVKAWIRYFKQCQSNGIKLRFIECSTSIVEQMNLISNFTCGGIVESIYVPFSCTQCHTELLGLFKTADLKKINFEIPTLKCSKCAGQAEFDDIPEEFFGFLRR